MKGEAAASGLMAVLALGVVGPARAFDCAKAATKSEKAICDNPAARSADDAMAKAFAAALAPLSPSDKAAALTAQIKWIGERDNKCSAAKGAKLAGCLATESASRRTYLAAEPEAGPGAPGRLAPAFRMEKGSRTKAEINLQLLRFPAPATPAERAFDAAVDSRIGSLDDPDKDDPGTTLYEHDRSMRLAYASARLISAEMSGYDSTGGAHPNSFTSDINILGEEGREAKFADLLDAKGASRMFALCLKSVMAQKKEREGADARLDAESLKELTKNVAEATGRIEAWSFGAQAATVTYDPYAVGAYAEGAFDCKLPYATLKPLARPSFPLP
jgi:uncharacterized protein YecT (DUF1311 family)